MSKVICLASAKGGSGKTVLTATFATFLAGIGKKTIMVDVDQATYGLTLLYLTEVKKHADRAGNKGRRPRGLFDGLAQVKEGDVVKLKNEIDLIPATYDFREREEATIGELRAALQPLLMDLRRSYDFVFLDGQAGSSDLSRLAMSKDICDEVVIVSEYDPMSAAGVERLKGLLREELTYIRTWVLLNKMLPEFVKTFSDFLEVTKYLSPIPWDADVVRAYSRRRLALDMEYGNVYTLAVMQTLKGLLGEGIGSEIEEWAENRASNIRQPLEEQYRDAEMELEGLLKVKARDEEKRVMRRLRWVLASVVPLLGGIGLLMMGKLDILTDWFGSYSEVVIKIGIAFIIAITMILVITRFGMKTGESLIAKSRFDRQKAFLENRLKNLEVLREANLETLVKEWRKK